MRSKKTDLAKLPREQIRALDMQARTRVALRVEELSDDDLSAIAATRPAPEADRFDDEDPSCN